VRDSPRFQNSQQLLNFLLQTETLTTPVLERYFGCQLHIVKDLDQDRRMYRLLLPSGVCVEAGFVRALSSSAVTLLQVDMPLGTWALKNGFKWEKRNITPARLTNTDDPVVIALGGNCNHIIGRSYELVLMKEDLQLALLVSEFWNFTLF